MESGPFRVDGKGGLVQVEGGWEEYATIVFSGYWTYHVYSQLTKHIQVDQPAGTGLSYTSTDKFVHELSDVCANIFSKPSIYLKLK